MNRRTSLLLYLVLNIFVSAATTFAVLYAWDRYFKDELNQASGPISGEPATVVAALPVTPTDAQPPPAPALPQPTATLPPLDQPVIEFFSVVGPGDLDTEMVLLKRVGPNNLRMVGWQIVGEGGSVYTFPDQPELILYVDGAVQVHTRHGQDTATDVYWNRDQAAWRSGEILRLYDSKGAERAFYRVP